MTDRSELEALRDALLVGRHVELPDTDPGYGAFERHQLLAIRFHRAARLNAPGTGEREGWRQYFREHFPRGDEHAVRLWDDWRGRLVKDEFPGEGVVVSHGQPHAHWKIVDPGQRLYVDLESMWTDFEGSLESLVELLASDDERRAATLEKWAKRQWSVQQVTWVDEYPPVTDTSASVATSYTVTMPRDPSGPS